MQDLLIIRWEPVIKKIPPVRKIRAMIKKIVPTLRKNLPYPIIYQYQ